MEELGAMVSTKPAVNGATGSTEANIPPGRYHVVGWDLDTTGRRLIDEICQIAAFSPTSKFAQYVMPHRDISIGAQRRHNIRVATIGRYRMLKDSKTGKILKTKSEISALTDFLQWLESLRGSSLDGIILINHEPFKVIAPMLLESLRRYNLLDRFSAVVKGFVNGYSVAEAKCTKTVRFFSLRTLSKMLLNQDPVLDNAADRAQLIYEIAHRLCVEDDKPDETSVGNGDGVTENSNLILGKEIYKFGVTLEVEEKAIDEMKLVLDRQKGLTPVFATQLRVNLRQRQRATVLRRLLAAGGVDFAMLAKNYAEHGNTGIDNVLATLSSAKPRDISDLKDILLHYFDPLYKPPTDPKPRSNRQRKPRKESVTDTSSNTTKTVSSPDASSASTSARSENNSPAKMHDSTEQSVIKVEAETPKPPRSESQPTTVKQEKNDEVSAMDYSENKSTKPGVPPTFPALESTPTLPESKPSLPESKPSLPESKPSLPESKPSLPESEPSFPESEPSLPDAEPSLPDAEPSLPDAEPSLPEAKPSLPESKATLPEFKTASLESKSTLPESFSLELKSEPIQLPKISSVSSGPLQQEQSLTESELVKQEHTTTDSPAS